MATKVVDLQERKKEALGKVGQIWTYYLGWRGGGQRMHCVT